jgi:hypothetical protein
VASLWCHVAPPWPHMAPLILYLCIYFYSYIILVTGGPMWCHSGATGRHRGATLSLGLQTLQQPTEVHSVHYGVPFCLQLSKPFCPKNMSYQYMKCLISRVFRVFLPHLEFPLSSLKIQRIFKIYKGKMFRKQFSIILFENNFLGQIEPTDCNAVVPRLL